MLYSLPNFGILPMKSFQVSRSFFNSPYIRSLTRIFFHQHSLATWLLRRFKESTWCQGMSKHLTSRGKKKSLVWKHPKKESQMYLTHEGLPPPCLFLNSVINDFGWRFVESEYSEGPVFSFPSTASSLSYVEHLNVVQKWAIRRVKTADVQTSCPVWRSMCLRSSGTPQRPHLLWADWYYKKKQCSCFKITGHHSLAAVVNGDAPEMKTRKQCVCQRLEPKVTFFFFFCTLFLPESS